MRWNQSEGITLALGLTLTSGQTFRWRKDNTGVWWGMIGDCGAALSQSEENREVFRWQTFPVEDRWEVVEDYFRLQVDLEALYRVWSEREPALRTIVHRFRGLRVLRQPPQECLFGFLCATCNTVTKIERSVYKLAERCGTPLLDPCLPPQSPPLFQFPKLNALAEIEEAVLRSDLWGYRAPRVIRTAQALLEKPEDYLLSLRANSLTEIRTELTSLYGIGTKLADCIALFSLDKDEAVPVDTHIRQIAVRHFAPGLAGKSLTPKVYAEIEAAYRDRFGDYAGWAQQYLFCGELSRSKNEFC